MSKTPKQLDTDSLIKWVNQISGKDDSSLPEPTVPEKSDSQRSLLPVHHPNRDFFLCDLYDYSLKDDNVSMEAPLFTLSTKKDTRIYKWASKDGKRMLEITPSVLGRATQFDKDLLIYVISQLTAALNQGRPDAKNRTVRFVVYDFLVSTNKPTGGREYKRMQDGLDRLKGTTIKTNIKTGGMQIKQGFGLIDSWRIIEKSPEDETMIAVEVELSQWFHNAVQAMEVLTINPNYFRLRKPIERRLYEIARKHCGHQSEFTISLALLLEKTGSTSTRFEFRRSIKEIVKNNLLPDYSIHYDENRDMVIFKNREIKVLPNKIN